LGNVFSTWYDELLLSGSSEEVDEEEEVVAVSVSSVVGVTDMEEKKETRGLV
jgi:hypothetical protein